MRNRLLLALFLLLTGCSALTRTYPTLPTRQAAARETRKSAAHRIGEQPYQDYVGVIHIHTAYSHDAHGTFESAIRVANAQRLDYLIFTEHNHLRPLRDGKQGWHGTVLALIGMEISARGGHYLAMNIAQEIDRSQLTTQQVIDEVNRQGGLGFIAHPYFKQRRWTDWTVTGFTGMEAYNVAHDTLDENKLRLAVWTVTASAEQLYLSLLDRPYDPLAKWDELIRQHGRVVGIGSSDAHEFHLLGLKFAPYEIMFQMSRTHLLIPSETLTDQLVYDALRKGHAYLAIELVGEAKGFSFQAEDGKQVLGIMGDTVPLLPNLTLAASIPASSQMTLMKDGQAFLASTGDSWRVPITEPGAYRLEVMHAGKPWIFSNPIYVTPAASLADVLKR